jgi:hypothetical protein
MAAIVAARKSGATSTLGIGSKDDAQRKSQRSQALPGWSRGPQRDAGLTTLASFFAAKSQQNPRGVIFSDAELSEIVVVVNVFRRTEGVRFGDPSCWNAVSAARLSALRGGFRVDLFLHVTSAPRELSEFVRTPRLAGPGSWSGRLRQPLK